MLKIVFMIDVGKKERLKFMYIAQYIRQKCYILVQDSLSFCKERMLLSLQDCENAFQIPKNKECLVNNYGMKVTFIEVLEAFNRENHSVPEGSLV